MATDSGNAYLEYYTQHMFSSSQDQNLEIKKDTPLSYPRHFMDSSLVDYGGHNAVSSHPVQKRTSGCERKRASMSTLECT